MGKAVYDGYERGEDWEYNRWKCKIDDQYIR